MAVFVFVISSCRFRGRGGVRKSISAVQLRQIPLLIPTPKESLPCVILILPAFLFLPPTSTILCQFNSTEKARHGSKNHAAACSEFWVLLLKNFFHNESQVYGGHNWYCTWAVDIQRTGQIDISYKDTEQSFILMNTILVPSYFTIYTWLYFGEYQLSTVFQLDLNNPGRVDWSFPRHTSYLSDMSQVIYICLRHTCEKRVMWWGWLFWQKNNWRKIWPKNCLKSQKFGLKMA